MSTYLILLFIGLATVLVGFKLPEEVYRLAVVVTGLIERVWGVSWAPDRVQLSVGILSVGVYRLWSPSKS